MYKAVTLAGGIREPLLTCSSSVNICFVHDKKKLLFCIQQKLICILEHKKMAAKAKVRLKLLDVYEDNFVDMNGSLYR